MIRLVLPAHLRTLAQVGSELELHVAGPVTPAAILDALESRYPVLRGTIRDHVTHERRPLVALLCVRGRRVARSSRRSGSAGSRGRPRTISHRGSHGRRLIASGPGTGALRNVQDGDAGIGIRHEYACLPARDGRARAASMAHRAHGSARRPLAPAWCLVVDRSRGRVRHRPWLPACGPIPWGRGASWFSRRSPSRPPSSTCRAAGANCSRRSGTFRR